MNTLFPRLLIVAAIISTASSAALAQGQLRRFDDLNFTALTAARDLRWEIHDEFAKSRDQQHLLKDIDNLITDLHQLQKMIYQRRSARELDRELDHALEHVKELKEHLLGCDFAVQRPASIQLNAKGYSFQPQTRSAGRVHVDHALQMLAGIDANLNQLHRELTGIPTPPSTMPAPHRNAPQPAPIRFRF